MANNIPISRPNAETNLGGEDKGRENLLRTSEYGGPGMGTPILGHIWEVTR